MVEEDQGLVGKVVMAIAQGAVHIGILKGENPLTLKEPYLTITGGSMHPTNIRVESRSGVVDGNIKPYTSDRLESYLSGYCHGVDVAKAVTRMVGGLYGNNTPTEGLKENQIT